MKKRNGYLAISIVLVLLGGYLALEQAHKSSISQHENAQRVARARDWKAFIDNEINNIKSRKLPLKDIAGVDTMKNIRTARAARNVPHFALFDFQGNITEEAIQSLQLTDEKLTLLSGLAPKLIKVVRKELYKSVKSDPARAEAQGGLAAFSIAPFQDRLVDSFNQFGVELVKTLGRDRAGELLLMIPIEQMYNSFGKDEVIGTLTYFNPIPGDPSIRQKTVILEVRDGVSGEIISSGGSPDLDLRYEYPGLFDEKLNPINPE
jgi:hypothetical protein